MSTTVLVTGATGFVGSHALEALSEYPQVRLIAACRDRRRLPPGFNGEVREGDFYDPAYREQVLEGVEVVVNAFAWTSAWGHAEASRRLFLEPSLAFIEHCLNTGVRRFVNVSSTSAAAPEHSAEPMSRGVRRSLWPHLANVVTIEDRLREYAGPEFTVMNLRFGLFAGRRYALGLLPLLVPRLKTHLVPWVAGGRTGMPIVDGRDIGQALALAATVPGLAGYQGFNVAGPEVPRVREVLELLHREYGLPLPHFGVPFALAYPFARLMEWFDPLVPWDPLVTRSIVHLLEETGTDNRRASELLGYRPRYPWQEAVRTQMAEMLVRQSRPMPMAKAIQ